MQSCVAGAARLAVILAISGATPALAQDDPPVDDEPGAIDVPTIPSRVINVDQVLAGVSKGARTQWYVTDAAEVRVPGAAWLRLEFSDVVLAGDPAGEGAVVRITSLHDHHSQHLNAASMRQWASTSAYFNGDAVLVELLCRGSGPASSLRIKRATAGEYLGFAGRTICGIIDDRVPATERGSGRLLPVGCTAWLFDDLNRTFLTAGHCGVGPGAVVQFDVPPSWNDGTIQHPPPESQFAVDPGSAQVLNQGLGHDFAYFAASPNSETSRTPFQHEGVTYELAAAPPMLDGQRIRITGYGTVGEGMPPEFNQTLMTHVGAYSSVQGTVVRYTADTTGGNSGSPVFIGDTKLAIGIHTNGGCTPTGGANQGMSIAHPSLQAALRAPRGLCASGLSDSLTGSVFVAGDLNNNFGVIDAASRRFAMMSRVAPAMRGLAYDPRSDEFYGADGAGMLWRINAATGVSVCEGEIRGVTARVEGLGFDPSQRRLFGVVQLTGQIVRIDLASRVAAPLGAPLGGNIGALDFAPTTGQLYALDDTLTGTVLLRIDPSTGIKVVVGALGQGLTDCNALAFDPEIGTLVTIDTPTGRLFRVNMLTGAATLVGPTGGVFGASLGMAGRPLTRPCPADFNASGGVPDDADVAAFFLAWNEGETRADFNNSGGVPDDADVAEYFAAFAGGC
ncbi:MAG: trypsin-like peptidase domain-containing protein [Phycisphaerales bacterium]|nr:trypsin-like peptidase domain-containing protein [Phycisphaerales bacterium]